MVNDQDAGTARRRAIRERAEKATAGPWTFRVVKRNLPPDGSVMIGAVAPGHQIRANPPGGSYPSNDGDFIAHARTDIPELLAELDAAAAARASAEQEAADWRLSFETANAAIGEADASREALIEALREVEVTWREQARRLSETETIADRAEGYVRCANALAAVLASEQAKQEQG